MAVRYRRLAFASRDHERVSYAWHTLLFDLYYHDHVQFNVNEGHRTMARQAELVREKGVWSASNQTGAARPSPIAPHIRTGRSDHAIDFDNAAAVVAAAAKRGVRCSRPIAAEPWHVEANRSDLVAYYRKRQAAIRKAKAQKAAEAAKRKAAALAAALKRRPARLRRLSPKGAEFIASFEGFRSAPYQDVVHVWTIGYGHTGGVSSTTKPVTKEQALKLLYSDAHTAANAVRSGAKVSLSQGEFDALVSFAYNVGVGALQSSTLLRKLNAGDRQGAADEFLRWNKAGGNVWPGLTRRRQAERGLFLS